MDAAQTHKIMGMLLNFKLKLLWYTQAHTQKALHSSRMLHHPLLPPPRVPRP